MAKRLIDWQEVGSVLKMSKYNGKDSEGNDIPNEELESFDMELLFPQPESDLFYEDGDTFQWEGFKGLSEVQKFIFVYGLKQKLADAGSGEKDPVEKAVIAKAKFQDFVDGKLTAVRANGTGAKANKAFVDNVKKITEEVSYKGLLMKQTLFPETFTEEDASKLKEFEEIMWNFSKKQEKTMIDEGMAVLDALEEEENTEE